MKIIVFSDSHQDETSIKKMLEYEKNIDKIYCSGDSGLSKEKLQALNIISIKGNYPFAPKLPIEKTLKLGKFKVLLTHGHKYHVKFGLKRLFDKTLKLKVDMVIFGHTHQIYLQANKKFIALNPGALSTRRSYSYPSYARIFIEDKKMVIEIVNLFDFKVVKQLEKVKND